VSWYPADSDEARELRERGDDVEAAPMHEPDCTGWLGEDLDGRPRPCPICKPDVVRRHRRRRPKR
jgi:hypothetical protein